MLIFRFPSPQILSLLAALWLAPSLLSAAEVMAPPEVKSSGQASPQMQVESMEDTPNLRDELHEPDKNANVDIRSYKRNDGTIVTEYGPKGNVTQIKVQPPGGLPAYYLYRNANGEFERRLTSGAKPVVPPSWILKEF